MGSGIVEMMNQAKRDALDPTVIKLGEWQFACGPRQAKDVQGAWRGLVSLAKSRRQITDTMSYLMTSPFSPPRLEGVLVGNDVGEKFGWLVTRENCRAVQEAIVEASKLVPIPDDDCRTTAEERAEREKAQQERNAKDAEHRKLLDACKARLMAKKPAWADALIVAEQVQDESDSMTDYFGSKTLRRVAIGWRRGKKEDFRQLREAAGKFEETKHLGPGCDRWYVLVWDGPEGDRNDFRPRHKFVDVDGRDEWPTRIEAETAIRNVSEAELFGFELESESFEHRENYSMGGGNFLKAGGKNRDGWKVKSMDISELSGTYNVIEDGFPVVQAGEVAAVSEVSEAGASNGEGWEVQKHHHTKRCCDVWIVVLSGRVERDEFERLRDSCKRAGGWYSRQWGQVPGGFAFDAEGKAKEWATENV